MTRLTSETKRLDKAADWHALSSVYTVRGRGMFPIDMLRYDQAVPATEADSHSIINSAVFVVDPGEISVDLRAVKPPTVGRWHSFGWSVIEEK